MNDRSGFTALDCREKEEKMKPSQIAREDFMRILYWLGIVSDRPGGFHADPLLVRHSLAPLSLVSTGRFSEIPLDVLGSKYQVLAGLSLTEILVSEAPFLLLVFWIGIGALVTTLMNKL